MKKKEILARLKNDEDYYGDFGNQYLSNSHVGRLIKDLNLMLQLKIERHMVTLATHLQSQMALMDCQVLM